MPTPLDDVGPHRPLTPPEIALLVRHLREARTWSQEQLADVARLSTRTVQRLEQGLAGSLDTLRAVASALGFEDVDALSKAYDIPTAERLAQARAEFDAQHVTLDTLDVPTGKALAMLLEQSNALLFHDAAELSGDAALAWAELEDYSREYVDSHALYSAVDKLAVHRELEGHLQRLTAASCTPRAATRPTTVSGLHVSVLYLLAFPRGQEPAHLVVAKELALAI